MKYRQKITFDAIVHNNKLIYHISFQLYSIKFPIVTSLSENTAFLADVFCDEIRSFTITHRSLLDFLRSVTS